MSEYQYYEFQALDRRLTDREMATLRKSSSRARITPTSFVNEYEWGDFRGDEKAWMEKYFDAFLYFANWGSRVVKLRVPSRLLDGATAKPYCGDETLSLAQTKEHTIVTWASENVEEEDEDWPEEEDALGVLIPIRAGLARGDLRSLYIGWLRSAQIGEISEEQHEPPVPPGLRKLDGALARLADFLRVDPDLLDAAAAASPAMSPETLTRATIRQWLAGRSDAEKNAYLERFIAGDEPALATELQRLVCEPHAAASTSGGARTAGDLLRTAQAAREERERREAEQAEQARRRREEQEALARSKYLEGLDRKEPAVWAEIATLIATKKPDSYDRVVTLLVDLRDLAALQGRESTFVGLLEALRLEHARKPSLLERMDRKGL